MASVEIYRARVEELIRQADITTVSARKVRKQIETLTNTSLAPVKKEFDELVMEIYEKITDDIEHAVLTGGQNPGSNGVQHHQPSPAAQRAPPVPKLQQQQQQFQAQAPQTHSFGFALPPTSFVPPSPPKPAPAAAVSRSASSKTSEDSNNDDEDDDDGDESDASFSSVEEGKTSSKGSSGTKRTNKKAKTTPATSSKSKKAGSKKSKATPTKKEKEKTTKAKRKTPVNEDGTPKVNNFTRPMIISPTLNEVIGHAGAIGPSGRVEMSRPEVVKQIWVYIKENNLQTENDKRMINCDSKLKTLFGQDQINCFTMNKYLGSHLSKPEQLA
ncbi:hypothetical protein EDD11_003639 [Mortierella claussenii]|nr:hypothetical protein EDD11_003639 [Mortierella claussenii]